MRSVAEVAQLCPSKYILPTAARIFIHPPWLHVHTSENTLSSSSSSNPLYKLARREPTLRQKACVRACFSVLSQSKKRTFPTESNQLLTVKQTATSISAADLVDSHTFMRYGIRHQGITCNHGARSRRVGASLPANADHPAMFKSRLHHHTHTHTHNI